MNYTPNKRATVEHRHIVCVVQVEPFEVLVQEIEISWFLGVQHADPLQDDTQGRWVWYANFRCIVKGRGAGIVRGQLVRPGSFLCSPRSYERGLQFQETLGGDSSHEGHEGGSGFTAAHTLADIRGSHEAEHSRAGAGGALYSQRHLHMLLSFGKHIPTARARPDRVHHLGAIFLRSLVGWAADYHCGDFCRSSRVLGTTPGPCDWLTPGFGNVLGHFDVMTNS